MISFREILIPSQKLQDISLFILRFLPSYYMVANHGWKKITNPEKWERYGNFFTKYFGDILDFANVPFGFMASFSESICAIMVLAGIFTQPASILIAFTMLVAAMHHITGTGSPENAFVFFSIYTAIALVGPGRYSLDFLIFLRNRE
tara:strand:- start:2251 stop:2691 length:441 start_codon:yes stop_codon:yes gene_type:complete